MPYAFGSIDLKHIPDHDLRGVGLVAQAWAYLEGVIERIIWLAVDARHEDQGLGLTTHMTVRSRYETALTLLSLVYPDSEPYKAFKALRGKITGDLAGKRNDIVHSRLHGLPDFPNTYRIVHKARGEVKKELRPVAAEEYDIVAGEIVDATNKLIDIANSIAALIIARGDTPPNWMYRHPPQQ